MQYFVYLTAKEPRNRRCLAYAPGRGAILSGNMGAGMVGPSFIAPRAFRGVRSFSELRPQRERAIVTAPRIAAAPEERRDAHRPQTASGEIVVF